MSHCASKRTNSYYRKLDTVTVATAGNGSANVKAAALKTLNCKAALILNTH